MKVAGKKLLWFCGKQIKTYIRLARNLERDYCFCAEYIYSIERRKGLSSEGALKAIEETLVK